MKKNIYLPELIMLALLAIGIAFIVGLSVGEQRQNVNCNINMANKVQVVLNKAIEKIDTMVEALTDKLLQKLPENVQKIGKCYLQEGWMKLKQLFLNKIGAQ